MTMTSDQLTEIKFLDLCAEFYDILSNEPVGTNDADAERLATTLAAEVFTGKSAEEFAVVASQALALPPPASPVGVDDAVLAVISAAYGEAASEALSDRLLNGEFDPPVKQPPTRAELLASLKETLRALETHISDKAKEHNLPVSSVCPCWTNEVKRARALIKRAT